MENNIMMSVDMDEWYHCRWATGSPYAHWPDTTSFFKSYYKKDKPMGEIIPLTEAILEIFTEFNITATFFFTGEVAFHYPQLVRTVSANGHEIASHNYVHKDYNLENPKAFRANLHKSKVLLEDLSSSRVIGYRAPNLTVSPYMIEALLEEGFLYDSSVVPTRAFMGKYGNFINAPRNPYILDLNDLAREGNSGLWEFPLPVFPVLRLPSGSGITSRICGYYYTVISLQCALKQGDTVYYFHPYEIGPRPNLPFKNPYTMLFLRNIGQPYLKMLKKLCALFRGRFISGKMLYEKLTGNKLP
ncbi:MAG: polysaccharide deacetylase family protein [Clostridia bacterium]|nr:polysaccharide deacetylase family protein [Clostridia bacterium]